MAIELKDLTAIIDLPADVDSVDKVKDHFNKTFVARKLAADDDEIKSAITGELFGKLNTKAAQAFGLKAGEIKDKKIEEIIEIGVSRYTGKIKELEDSKNATNDEATKKLTTERDKYKTDYDTTYGMLQDKEKEFTGFKTEVAEREKKSKINFRISEAKKKLSFKEGISPFEQKGYDDTIQEFNYDFDDKDEIVVRGKDGKPLPNAAKSGTVTLQEHLEKIADEGKILKKNNSTNTGYIKQFEKKKVEPSNNGTPTRQIAANAVKLGT